MKIMTAPLAAGAALMTTGLLLQSPAASYASSHNHLAQPRCTRICDTGLSIPDLQAAYDPGVIQADVASTILLPDGSVAWLGGDALTINGTSVWDPHSEITVEASPGSASFTVQKTPAGGWQQVPNWPDGTVFWMADGAVDNGVLHIFGARIDLSTGGLAAVPGGPYYDATFSLPGLAYQGISQIPYGVSSVAQGTGGTWLLGTDHVPGACPWGDCYSAHAIWAATGQLGNPGAWAAPVTIMPASDQLGGVVSITRTAGGGWTAWTKQDDILGAQVERLNAAGVEKPWTVTGSFPIPTACTTACESGWLKPLPTTYGCRVHPGFGEPSGTDFVTCNENDYTAADGTGFYGPQFMQLPDK